MGVAEVEYNVYFCKTRYKFTIPAVGGNDDDALDGEVVHPDGENGKSKCMVAE